MMHVMTCELRMGRVVTLPNLLGEHVVIRELRMGRIARVAT